MIDIARNSRTRGIPTSSQVLVDGAFAGQDARDLVSALLDSTLNFHKLRNLKSQVNRERPDLDALRAIAELGETRADWKQLLGQGTRGLRVRVRTTVELEIEPGPVDHAE